MSEAAGLVFLIGRILFTLFYLFSAAGHLTQGAMMVGYARSEGMPLPELAGWPAGVYLLVASLSVILGVWPDIGALLLGLWTIPTALIFHNFWAVKDPQERLTQQFNFLRNVTFLGGALALFAVFAGLGPGVRYTLTAPLLRF